MIAEQRIEALEAELERVRAAASADLQNLQADLIAKNRMIGRLEAELAKQAEDSPEADAAKRLLRLWRDVHRKGRKNVDVTLSSDRGRAMLKAIKSKGEARVERAILGAQYDDWAMGRTAKQDRPYNDVAKHILRDSDRFEHFELLWEKHHNPEAPKPAPVERPKLVRRDDRLPIDKVLDALPHDFREGLTQHCWTTRCPAHEDRDPSLSIRLEQGELGGQIVLLNCFAGCPTELVLSELGLCWADLFEHRDVDQGRRAGPRPRPMAAHLRDAMKQLLGEDAA